MVYGRCDTVWDPDCEGSMQITPAIKARGEKQHANADKHEMLLAGDEVLSGHLSTIFVLRLDEGSDDAKVLFGVVLRTCSHCIRACRVHATSQATLLYDYFAESRSVLQTETRHKR